MASQFEDETTKKEMIERLKNAGKTIGSNKGTTETERGEGEGGDKTENVTSHETEQDK